MGNLSLKNINKVYPNGYHAVHDVSLEIESGEFIVFVGPSGCGKSTTLRMIAGLESISTGDMLLNDKRVNDLAPSERNIAMVFQNYALYGHMTVYENIGFGLTVQKTQAQIKHEAIMQASEITALNDELNKKPGGLSGGQRQRVALGRAIVRDTELFLMDEPLSNLDAKLRATTRREIVELTQKIDSTVIYVTHDQIEAMTMADRIVIMDKGVIQQVASPKEMYDYPENTFVARFIGSPAMNICTAKYHDGKVIIADKELELPKAVAITAENYQLDQIEFGLRPEHIHSEEIYKQAFPNATFEVTVTDREMLGDVTLVGFDINGTRFHAKLPSEIEVELGMKIEITFNLNNVQLFDQESTRRLREE